MLKTLKTKIKKFKNHFSCTFLSFSLHKIHFSATKQSHGERERERERKDFFLLYFFFSSATKQSLKHTVGHKLNIISNSLTLSQPPNRNHERVNFFLWCLWGMIFVQTGWKAALAAEMMLLWICISADCFDLFSQDSFHSVVVEDDVEAADARARAKVGSTVIRSIRVVPDESCSTTNVSWGNRMTRKRVEWWTLIPSRFSF